MRIRHREPTTRHVYNRDAQEFANWRLETATAALSTPNVKCKSRSWDPRVEEGENRSMSAQTSASFELQGSVVGRVIVSKQASPEKQPGRHRVAQRAGEKGKGRVCGWGGAYPTRMPSSMSVGDTRSPRPTTNWPQQSNDSCVSSRTKKITGESEAVSAVSCGIAGDELSTWMPASQSLSSHNAGVGNARYSTVDSIFH